MCLWGRGLYVGGTLMKTQLLLGYSLSVGVLITVNVC